MSSIFVHFWGYKSKDLPEAVNALISNQSGQNNISVVVYDQTNLSREERFPGAKYNHVVWDRIESPYTLLNESLRNSQSDFFMYIDGAIKFEKNWDIELVMSSGDRDVVISGNHRLSFMQDYKFYPIYNKEYSEVATVSNWITSDFIFMNSKLFKSFPDISELKYLGLEDVYSLYAAHMCLPVQSIATAWCSRIDDSVMASDYVPFSIRHKYWKVHDIYAKKYNAFFNDTSCVDALSIITGFDFSRLSRLPFSTDDVSYNRTMSIDAMESERFIHTINRIG